MRHTSCTLRLQRQFSTDSHRWWTDRPWFSRQRPSSVCWTRCSFSHSKTDCVMSFMLRVIRSTKTGCANSILYNIASLSRLMTAREPRHERISWNVYCPVFQKHYDLHYLSTYCMRRSVVNSHIGKIMLTNMVSCFFASICRLPHPIIPSQRRRKF